MLTKIQRQVANFLLPTENDLAWCMDLSANRAF